MDGVELWRTTRELYDFNPPLVPYREVKRPPPLLPELLSSLKVGQLFRRGRIHKDVGGATTVHTGFYVCEAARIRQKKQQWATPFNVLTSAAAAPVCFTRHPQATKINLGITVCFPFLKTQNRYGVILVSIQRGSVQESCRQLQKRIPKPMLIWGTTAIQA